jgi:hypothetical protein
MKGEPKRLQENHYCRLLIRVHFRALLLGLIIKNTRDSIGIVDKKLYLVDKGLYLVIKTFI